MSHKYTPIDSFSLPSNSAVTIFLRQATVRECEAYSSFADGAEEAVISDMLDNLQYRPEKYVDPRTWTARDRQFAALWYFAATSSDVELHIPYSCKHCGEDHDTLVHYSDLLQGYKEIEGKPVRSLSTKASGKQWSARPLDGYGAEEIEGLRLSQDSSDKGSAEYNRINAIINRHKLVACLDFEGSPDDRDSKIEAVESALLGMDSVEFLALKAEFDAAMLELDHGLDCVTEKETLYLRTPPIECDKEAGKFSRIRFPVQFVKLLPRYFA